MYSLIQKLSNRNGILILLILFLTSMVLINGSLIGVEKLREISDGVGILDLERSYTPDQGYEILKGLGEEGRAFYRNVIIPQDFVFPILYALFLASSSNMLYKGILKRQSTLQIITFIPIVIACSDFIENVLILNILNAYPDEMVGLIQASNVFTVIKNGLFAVSMVLLFAGIITYIVKRIRKQMAV